MAKKFTFADAKKKIQTLEEKLNVALDDNIVTQAELKTLRVYKAISIASLCIFIVWIVSLFV